MERYAVVETKENGNLCVTHTPKRFIIDDILYWPNTPNVDRVNPVIGEWLEFSFVMPKDDLTFVEAIAKEKVYSEFRNSESEREHQNRRALKRKHPVNMMSTGSEIDVNDMIKFTHKKAKSVESKALQKTDVTLQLKKQKQRKRNLQKSNANPKLKSKSGIETSSKSKKPVTARNAPSSTFIPNRSENETSSKSNESVPARSAPSSTFIPNRSVLCDANSDDFLYFV